jgi:membrane protein
MASLKERVTAAVDEVRRRWPFIDHVFAVVGHYSAVNGSAQAGAVTYYGFLSFFPLLALAFFAVGFLASVYPDARADLVSAINDLLPGMVGNGPGQIPLSPFEEHARAVGLVGAVALLYTGLSWLSGMRDALVVMFALPKRDKPGFVVGKSRDLLVLLLVGLILMASVALSGAVDGFSRQILAWLGLQGSRVGSVVLWVLAHGLGIAATLLLFLAMFELLAQPHLTRRALLSGALLGAVGFEVLKAAANFLIGLTKDQPAFQAFGVALILLVWINYFSRIALYGAAWARTAPERARGGRPGGADDPDERMSR